MIIDLWQKLYRGVVSHFTIKKIDITYGKDDEDGHIRIFVDSDLISNGQRQTGFLFVIAHYNDETVKACLRRVARDILLRMKD